MAMTQAEAAIFKIPTVSPQTGRGPAVRRAKRPTAERPAVGRVLASGTGRAATRGGGEVIELEHGITVYPAREEAGRWRAVWHEDGERQQCEASTEEKLAAKLEKVIERLQVGAPCMKQPGAALIAHFLDPDRLPVDERWSRKHADTQRRLCERFAAPVIGLATCQDISTSLMQKIVNAAPTPGEGERVQRMISALVSAGLEGGYLANPRLAKVHWQAGDRPLPAVRVSVAGEAALWVDPAEVPAGDDISTLGRALAAGRHGEQDELMAATAAYSGLRWGELAALTIGQVDQAARVITVDRKVVEVAGHLYIEAPKNRKFRRTIYPRRTPGGYPLAERLAARIEAARADQKARANPLGLIFPSPGGKHWRSSNFNRRVLQRAYLAAGWRDGDGNGRWTWHSLRHVFCTTALFTWKLDPTDVSRMAGHANYRITLDMYVGSTAGVLDRARMATE
jgi:integrase